jgi:hypothetical protein
MRRKHIKFFQVGHSKKIPREEIEKIRIQGVSGADHFERTELSDDLAKQHETCVYLVRSETGSYKIGISCGLRMRMKTLYETIPLDLELIGILKVKDHRRLERELHDRYAERRQRGEWFLLLQRDIEEITNREDFHSIKMSLRDFLDIC